jgi:NTE family protein
LFGCVEKDKDVTMTNETNLTRAVILGGGGVTGIAWEIGVLAGLAEAGIDLAANDTALFGTSAGSFAAALIAGEVDIEERYRKQFEPDLVEVAASMSPEVIEQYGQAVRSNFGQAVPLALAYGQIAHNAATISTDVRQGVVEERLGMSDWPGSTLHFTAIDADTGELVVLDHSSGLTLTEAAMATGAVPGLWPMVAAGGRNWIDGGMISASNVQLGTGFDRVLVIAPVGVSTAGFDSVDAAADKLRSAGASVVVMLPDEATVEAIGPNPFDPTRRGPSAAAGRRQALHAASEIKASWLV